MKRTIFTILAVALVVSACGGGGGSDSTSTATPTSVEGLWIGTTSSNRSIAGVVLDDGSYWVLYSSIGNSAVVAGAVQGNGTSNNGSFTSSNGKDFNLEGWGVNNITLNASYVMNQSFNGTVTYTATGEQVTFTSTYDTDYDLTPSLSTIAGTYTGTGATSGGTESATVIIASSGAISGSSASGCTYTGTAAPRASGNIYDISITFGGGVCANGTSTVNGVASFDAATNQITAAGVNSSRTDGFISIGVKP